MNDRVNFYTIIQTCQENKTVMSQETPGFSDRFVEACGTSEPAEIQRLLNIKYQTVVNYLNGRLPKADKLIAISERTGYSIDWLLTGRRSKRTAGAPRENTPLPADQLETFVRRVLVKVLTEMNYGEHLPATQRSIKLDHHHILSEKGERSTVQDTEVPIYKGSDSAG